MKIPRTLNVVDLADIFGMDPGELLTWAVNRPDALPPRATKQGVAQMRWHRGDVYRWILSNRLGRAN